jgi:hypothetical protein
MTRSGPARRLHRLRVRASVLLAVFLSAGTSLPSVDGLLFHQDGSEPGRAQTHVEPAGGCLDHANHCVLGRTATGSGADVTPLTEVPVELASRPALSVAAQSLLSADATGLPNSRAPPVLLA